MALAAWFSDFLRPHLSTCRRWIRRLGIVLIAAPSALGCGLERCPEVRFENVDADLLERVCGPSGHLLVKVRSDFISARLWAALPQLKISMHAIVSFRG